MQLYMLQVCVKLKLGVFVGLAGADLSEVGSYLAQQGPYSTAGGHGAIASNRVLYLLGLLGPSMSVDTTSLIPKPIIK